MQPVLFHPNLSGPYDTAYFEQAVASLKEVGWSAGAPSAAPAVDAAPFKPTSFGAFAWGHAGSRGALLAEWTADDLLSPSMARTVQLMQQVSLADSVDGSPASGPIIVDDSGDHL